MTTNRHNCATFCLAILMKKFLARSWFVYVILNEIAIISTSKQDIISNIDNTHRLHIIHTTEKLYTKRMIANLT